MILKKEKRRGGEKANLFYLFSSRQKKSLAKKPGKFLHQYLCVKVPLLINSSLLRAYYCPKRHYKCNQLSRWGKPHFDVVFNLSTPHF